MPFHITANLRLHQTDLNWHVFLSLKMTEKLPFSSRSQIEVTLEILGRSLEQAGIPQLYLSTELVLMSQTSREFTFP